MSAELSQLDVAVLCGGRGGEREVSIVSGNAVHEGLTAAGLKSRLVALSPDFDELETLRCDVAFIALHGEYGEDGQIQQILEDKGILYTGSGVAASALAMDKDKSKTLAAKAGVPVAASVCGIDPQILFTSYIESKIGTPCVVKPNNGGSSVGVSIVKDDAAVLAAIEKAFACADSVMIEQFLYGSEMTVGVIGSTALPLVQMCPAGEFYDYHAKYHDDRTEYLCPAPCSDEVSFLCQKYALATFSALGLRDFARIDFIVTDTGPYLLEANSIPGFTSHSLLPKAAGVHGIEFSELCKMMVQMALAHGVPSSGGAC